MLGAESGLLRRGGPRTRGLLGNDRGVAFVAAVLAVGVLFLLVTAATALTSGEARATTFWQDRSEAVYVAESGLNHTLWKIKYEAAEIEANYGVYGTDPPTFTSDAADESAGVLPAGSSYEVWVWPHETDADARYVAVVGRVSKQAHLVRATIRQVPTNSPFYDPNGDGQATPDPDNPQFISYPNLPNLGVLQVSANRTVRIGPGTFLYSGIDIAGGGQLILDGDTTLWVLQYVKMSGTSYINYDAPGVPSDHTLVIFIPPAILIDGNPTQTVTLTGTSHFNGFIYAPTATCKVTGSSDVYGMIVGETVIAAGATTYNPEAENISWPSSVTIEYLIESYGG
jgi:hypothetical protein